MLPAKKIAALVVFWGVIGVVVVALSRIVSNYYFAPYHETEKLLSPAEIIYNAHYHDGVAEIEALREIASLPDDVILSKDGSGFTLHVNPKFKLSFGDHGYNVIKTG